MYQRRGEQTGYKCPLNKGRLFQTVGTQHEIEIPTSSNVCRWRLCWQYVTRDPRILNTSSCEVNETSSQGRKDLDKSCHSSNHRHVVYITRSVTNYWRYCVLLLSTRQQRLGLSFCSFYLSYATLSADNVILNGWLADSIVSCELCLTGLSCHSFLHCRWFEWSLRISFTRIVLVFIANPSYSPWILISSHSTTDGRQFQSSAMPRHSWLPSSD